MDKSTFFSETLSRFAPKEFIPYLTKLILEARVKFKIVPGRKTKLGDFRFSELSDKPTITVNGDLNPYSFLITSLHEIAHLNTFRNYGNSVQAHGLEWKNAFRELLEPILKLSEHLLKREQETVFLRLFRCKHSDCVLNLLS